MFTFTIIVTSTTGGHWNQVTLEPLLHVSGERYMLCIFKLTNLKDKNWSNEYNKEL